MNIVLVHPIHGAKVATQQVELEQDVKNGWTEYNPDTSKAATRKSKKDKAVVEEPVEQPAEQPIEQPNGTPEFLAPVSDESEGK